ncbi:MAG: COX15/CtaA family protein [Gemmatimonadetes bacterium]|nr:COX15/CtaA family protein [Gemmatimonadota bacterium]MCA9763813.1 COX15/CtaA family protein [Gemmatimonadota bacterium]MCA9769480.1 COX15/CtaA family protein [Gemmatimonadota bacterium]MCB9517997.1 COX15/CtaA family protein [Gemmatimonadales bacterium]
MTTDADARVRRWLAWAMAAVVLAVAIGGITRLTQSGLSITVWQPVTGVIPPLSAEAWQEAYQSYLRIPEAQGIHRGITLREFQVLFWWEWLHRILARVVGLVLAVPYLVLLAQGAIRRGHRARLALLPILALAQGALGWYMVQSGLGTRPTVSAYRLTAHLAMALLIFGICIWTALDLGRPRGPSAPQPMVRRGIAAALALTVATVLSGGLVAGLDAGYIHNTFPLMSGRIIPPGYHVSGLGLGNPFENPVAAQFHHRLLALTTAAVVAALWLVARRRLHPADRPVLTAAMLLVIVQVGLGITTLLLRVPVSVAVIHQVTGVLLFGAVLAAAHHFRRVTVR